MTSQFQEKQLRLNTQFSSSTPSQIPLNKQITKLFVSVIATAVYNTHFRTDHPREGDGKSSTQSTQQHAAHMFAVLELIVHGDQSHTKCPQFLCCQSADLPRSEGVPIESRCVHDSITVSPSLCLSMSSCRCSLKSLSGQVPC